MIITAYFRNPPPLPVAYAWWDFVPKAIAFIATGLFVFEAADIWKNTITFVYILAFYAILALRSWQSKSRAEIAKSLFLVITLMAGVTFSMGLATGGSVKSTLITITGLALHLSAFMFLSLGVISIIRAPRPENLAPLWKRVFWCVTICLIGLPAIIWKDEIIDFISVLLS